VTAPWLRGHVGDGVDGMRRSSFGGEDGGGGVAEALCPVVVLELAIQQSGTVPITVLPFERVVEKKQEVAAPPQSTNCNATRRSSLLPYR